MDACLSETEIHDLATAAAPPAPDVDQAASEFLDTRPRLTKIAYRILGSASETEDVVQEAWLRWQRTDRSLVRDPTAFLATTTTRLAFNLSQSARNRRETPADLVSLELADPAEGPEAGAERAEAVEDAVLLLLRNLSPAERAAYVLREAFGYPYQQIAEVLRLTAAYARQLVRRAHQRLAAEGRRPVSPTVHRRFVLVLRAAADAGELSDLERFLAGDVAS
jgi:RNA polymerase sigma-70 factor (ECF subfamily)